MKRILSLRSLALLAVLGILTFSSCVSHKKMLLLKDMEMLNRTTSIDYQNERSLDYKVQPGDNLYIHAVNIIDEKNSGALNNDAGRYSLGSEASIYLHSLTVNQKGFIARCMSWRDFCIDKFY